MSAIGIPLPKTAMVMAAGYGKRLRPLTQTIPKPMVPVLGRPIIDIVLDRLAASGIERAIVNLHHLGDILRDHLAQRQRPKILFSEETEILETGGGIVKALPLIGEDPFFVVNAKIVWFNGKEDALHRLAAAWDDRRMDSLLLLHPTVTAVGYEGRGDFDLDPSGRVRRRREWAVAPFLYAGIQLCHPRLFRAAPAGAFSTNRLWDRAIEEDRLYALRHDGEWYHVSTLKHLADVERVLRERGLAV